MDKDEKKDLLLLYINELSDLNAESLMLAVKELIRDPKTAWLPKIADIRVVAERKAAELKEQARRKREQAEHPEWFTPPLPAVEHKQPLVFIGNVLNGFGSAVGRKA